MSSINEHVFDENPEEGSPVITGRSHVETDALPRTRELRRRVLRDPEIRKRAQEVLDEIARGAEPEKPGITAEALPDFLRDQRD